MSGSETAGGKVKRMGGWLPGNTLAPGERAKGGCGPAGALAWGSPAGVPPKPPPAAPTDLNPGSGICGRGGLCRGVKGSRDCGREGGWE